MTLPDFDSYWDYNDPAGTEEKFQQLRNQELVARDPDYHAQLLTQIARTYSLRRMFDEAHALLDQVKEMLADETPCASVRYFLERGRTFNSAGKKAEALALFLKAWELGKSIRADKYAVDAVHMVAIVKPGEEGLAWNMRAIEYAESSEQVGGRAWLGSLYNNTGWSYHDLGQHDQALDLFQRALQFQVEQKNARKIKIARWCVARCLRSLGKIDEAYDMQRKLHEEALAVSAQDGYTQEELGELLLLKGDPSAARPYFKSAFELLSKDPWLVENEAKRLERLKRLG